MRRLLLTLALLGAAAPAQAWDGVRTCSDDSSWGQALSVGVDGAGTVHLLRVRRVGGDLLHTTLDPAGTFTDVVVAPRISRLVSDETSDTGLWVDPDGTLTGCWRNVATGRFEVGQRPAGAAWRTVYTVARADAGRSCAVARLSTGRLLVAFSDGDDLRVSWTDGGGWQTRVADAPGQPVGVGVRIAESAGGAVALVHHAEEPGRLRVTRAAGAGWQTVQSLDSPAAVGFRPAAVFDGELLYVAHGGRPNQPDVGPDAGLYLSVAATTGPFSPDPLRDGGYGGSNAAVRGAGVTWLLTRQLSRSALFGAADGLDLWRVDDAGFTREALEFSGSAGQRHKYRYLDAALDPFDQPVFAYQDERSAFFNDPAETPTCVYRLPDTDADAIPDEIELDLGTRPDLADTDGDGRSDGDEVLVDGTDPRVPDLCAPTPETCDGLDEDCDGDVDEGLARPCWPGAPANRTVGECRDGAETCAAGEWGACAGFVLPAAEQCDGRDNDCDGTTDEGTGGAPCATGGVGACGEGQTVCREGAPRCEPVGGPAPEVCNGRDDDCDGRTDEGTLRCGVGACAVEVAACVGGRDNLCRPDLPAAFDAVCDGIDSDCDGATDEDADPRPTTCGVGECFARGQARCVQGAWADDCLPGVAAAQDADCDRRDDDCDGEVDEDFQIQPLTCGLGRCARPGQRVCDDGVVRAECEPAPGLPDDATCDGLDDDCDGIADEDVPLEPIECGIGACTRVGGRRCVAGQLQDGCNPGPPAVNDATCDGVDDDCDGHADEDAPARAVGCGVGACRAEGVERCVDGALRVDCAPAPAAGPDDTCDGIDDDCDGRADEATPATPTRCGVGACAAEGVRRCTAGALQDSCAPGLPAGADADCDGVDQDCDGRVDEGFVAQPLRCGQGACAARGTTRCAAGVELPDCTPAPAPDPQDALCDGIDGDCDGLPDEGAPSEAIACGLGVCARAGRRLCVDGVVQDNCAPGPPVGADDTCDGLDDDCDGRVDEAAMPAPVTCGIGACEADGEALCQNGARQTVCSPGLPQGADDTCDGVDDDCDGRTDEGVQPQAIQCGRGACRAAGVRRCVDGALERECSPTPPVGDDVTCDGVDDDCDGRADEAADVVAVTCGVGACARPGVQACVAGQPQVDCAPGQPAGADDTCDGVDDDCDGRTDEGVPVTPTQCGLGGCAAEGSRRCVDGALVDTCQPGRPAPADDTCDGVDADCDGRTDEGARPSRTACGQGVCAADGERRCVDGAWIDGCQPGPPGGADADCDGQDEDCDGRVDEGYQPTPTACGAGACAAEGELRCVAGRVTDTCVEGQPARIDRTCDGRDDDCDGRADEDAAQRPIECGVGACRRDGVRICLDGGFVRQCQPGAPAAADASCDGVDDDCDGQVDEDASASATACGVGACAAAGVRRCQAGAWRDTCLPGPAAPTDDTCDGFDDDCDGVTDEGFEGTPIRCGRGVCQAQGRTRCVAGVIQRPCSPGPPSGADADCDGADDDCDGRTDEAFVGAPTRCGVGACAAQGATGCQGGRVVDSCEAGLPAPSDATCDGRDDDCDGRTDEGARSQPTACGAGACAADGTRACVGGAWRDDCEPGQAAANDATCDGVDDDCDGRADEDVAPQPTACGAGVCARQGQRLCRDGALVDTCQAGRPAGADDTCDGRDDDCDGQIDEAWRGRATRCGQGACERGGALRCQAGQVTDTCAPGAPRADDQCDGADNDCDGAVDEGAGPEPARCGLGVCQRIGARRCVDGARQLDCEPGEPAPSDLRCDGLDEDCDGQIDEDAAPRLIRCGVGACAREGRARCAGGRYVDDCQPGRPAAADATCDGVDDDCDGQTDEDAAPQPLRCGTGLCQAAGERACVAGDWVERCRPRQPLGDDVTCDGRDDDCDGVSDEAAPVAETACGRGACARLGQRRCVQGAFVDLCEPGPAAREDATCDNRDDDCDGRTDEDARPQPITCGVGACLTEGVRRCHLGREVEDCRPLRPAVDDRTCDGVDDDCDGLVDESCAPEPDPDAALPEPDAGEPEPDAGEPDAEPMRPDQGPDGEPPLPDAGAVRDALPLDATVPADALLDNGPPTGVFDDAGCGQGRCGDAFEVDRRPRPAEGCSCEVGPDAPGPGPALWFLLLALAPRRRRR